MVDINIMGATCLFYVVLMEHESQWYVEIKKDHQPLFPIDDTCRLWSFEHFQVL